VLDVTETTPPAAKPENVGRGTVFALATIPIAIIAFAIFGYIGVFPFIIGIATPFVAGWLYRLGAGGKLGRAGWVPFIVISMVSVVLGVFAGAIATVYKTFGFGGQFGNALVVNLRNFTPGGEGFFAVLGVILGIVGIVLTLRQVNATPAQQIAQNTAQWTPPAPDATTPPPPAAPAAPAAPSPGVTLNGEPVDPDKKP
jgi:hypothetical protein